MTSRNNPESRQAIRTVMGAIGPSNRDLLIAKEAQKQKRLVKLP